MKTYSHTDDYEDIGRWKAECDYCSDAKFVMMIRGERTELTRCPKCAAPQDAQRRADADRKRLLDMDGLRSDAERAIRLEELQSPDPSFALAKRAIADGIGLTRGFITITGPTGRGKTTLLIAAVNEARGKGLGACYRRAGRFLDDLMSSFRADGDERTHERDFRLVVDARVLCFDDVAAASPFARSQIRELLEERWRQREKCLTVLAAPALRGLPDEIRSRLRPDEGAYIELSGQDLRSSASPDPRQKEPGRNGYRQFRNGGKERLWNG